MRCKTLLFRSTSLCSSFPGLSGLLTSLFASLSPLPAPARTPQARCIAAPLSQPYISESPPSGRGRVPVRLDRRIHPLGIPRTGGSAYNIEGELGEQMDREEHAQMRYHSMSPPDEFGGSAGYEPPGVEYGDELEFDDTGMNGWGSHPATTYDASAYTAHQDFLRAAAQFVSPMGYDVPSPNDEVSDNPLGQQAAAPPAWSTEESAFDAFTRQAGMGASSMGYD